MEVEIEHIYYRTNSDIESHLDIIIFAGEYYQIGVQQIFKIDNFDIKYYSIFTPLEEYKKMCNKSSFCIVETRVTYDSDLYIKLEDGSLIVSMFALTNEGVSQELILYRSNDISEDFLSDYNTLEILEWNK